MRRRDSDLSSPCLAGFPSRQASRVSHLCAQHHSLSPHSPYCTRCPFTSLPAEENRHLCLGPSEGPTIPPPEAAFWDIDFKLFFKKQKTQEESLIFLSFLPKRLRQRTLLPGDLGMQP